MRLIDAEIMLQNYEGDVSAYHNAGHSLSNVEGWMRYYLSSAPTIDAVPVVRCGECRYRQKAKVNRKGFLICPASGMEITDDDYCSYGAKMEDKP